MCISHYKKKLKKKKEIPLAMVTEFLLFNAFITVVMTGLNIITGHWTISGKKSTYVRQKLLYKGQLSDVK